MITLTLRDLGFLGGSPTNGVGGTESIVTVSGTTYKVHTYNAIGTSSFTVIKAGYFEYLVVGGGGGGGGTSTTAYCSGGGGGGGFRTGILTLSPGAYTVTVGGGGSGGNTGTSGGNGSNSVFATITSAGGGGGGGGNSSVGLAGLSGGSGGGSSKGQSAGAGNTPSVSPSQGSNGGVGSSAAFQYGGGGGGGASAVGSNGSGTAGGNGGAGRQSIIQGTSNFYSGGGGGAIYSVAAPSSGGTGGGGAGGCKFQNIDPVAGSPNTGGGGGGGGGRTAGNGAPGGSGIVVIRYMISTTDPLYSTVEAWPILDLRFATDKSLNDAISLQNLITFSRASSGTYVDAAGVLQTAATNLLLRSEEFQTTWVSTRSSVSSDSATAPNGAATADKLVEDSTANNTHSINQGSVSFTSGLAYTFSCYVKEAGRQNVRLTFPSAAFTSAINAQFNLTNGTITATSAGVTSSVQAVGDGWYRCIVTATATTTATSGPTIFIGETASATTITYTGDGTSGIYIWGGQLEQSSTVGEYIPTTSTINSAPRFDHNPTTGESLGLMGEEQRTNLLLRSEEFDNVVYTVTDASISANATTAPNDTVTADRLTNTSTTATVAQSHTKAASAITYTASMFAKGSGNISFTIDSGTTTNRGLCSFNLANGTFASATNAGNFTNTSGSITSFLNGWHRITITTTTDALTTARLRFFWSGSGVSVDVWGAQLEAGASPTSYIPTTAAAATRSADVASIISSAIANGIRTVLVEFRSPAVGTRGIASLNANSSANSSEIRSSGTDARLAVISSSSSQADISGGAIVSSVRSRIAIRIATDSFAISVNGAAPVVDTSGTVPTVDRLFIGRTQAAEYLNGTISRLIGWTQDLSDANLQALSQQ